MRGSLGGLYKSIEALNNQYLQENISKDLVLNPKSNVDVPLLMLNEAPKPSADVKYYRCSSRNHFGNVTNDPNKYCPSYCGYRMSTEVTYLPSDSTVTTTTSSTSNNGFVKGVLAYMEMDNLEVKPTSTISAITLLNKFHVKDVGSLVEKEVQVGLDEGVAILKASLETKAVLSAVFL